MTFVPVAQLQSEIQNSNTYLNIIADVIGQARGIAGDIRTTIVGGNINVTGGALSSVTTVTNLAQIGAVSANTTVYDMMNMNATLANVNNFTI